MNASYGSAHKSAIPFLIIQGLVLCAESTPWVLLYNYRFFGLPRYHDTRWKCARSARNVTPSTFTPHEKLMSCLFVCSLWPWLISSQTTLSILDSRYLELCHVRQTPNCHVIQGSSLAWFVERLNGSLYRLWQYRETNCTCLLTFTAFWRTVCWG